MKFLIVLVAITISLCSAESTLKQIKINLDNADIKVTHVVTRDTEKRFLEIVSDFYNNVIFTPVNDLAQSLALMGAQLLAGIAVNGISGIGKRGDMDKRFLEIVSDFYNNVIFTPVNDLAQSLALMGAQLLAGIAVNGISGIGKRGDMDKRFLEIVSDFYNNVIFTPVNDLAQSLALMGAQLLAGIAVNGISSLG